MKLISLAALALVSTTLIGCGERKPTALDVATAKIWCADLIKEQLRDPDSYRFNKAKVVSNSGTYGQYGSVHISFRSKNGYGGYGRANAACHAFEKDGSLSHEAVIY